MSLWILNGKLVCDSAGHPIQCDNCPCQPCPTDCSACGSYAVALAFPGAYAANSGSVDLAVQTLEGGECYWQGDYTPPGSPLANVSVELGCTAGQWLMQAGGQLFVEGQGFFQFDADNSATLRTLANQCPPDGQYQLQGIINGQTITITATLTQLESAVAGAVPSILLNRLGVCHRCHQRPPGCWRAREYGCNRVPEGGAGGGGGRRLPHRKTELNHGPGGIMHIFFLGYPGSMGGANTECWHTAKVWRQHGVEVTFIPTWGRDQAMEDRLCSIGCRTIHVPNAGALAGVPRFAGAPVVAMCSCARYTLPQASEGPRLQARLGELHDLHVSRRVPGLPRARPGRGLRLPVGISAGRAGTAAAGHRRL